MRLPKPWYRKERKAWFVQIDGHKIRLGTDKESALAEYHKLMLKRGQGVPLGTHNVREVLDAYFDWYQQTISAETVKHRKPVLKSFGKSVPVTLKVSVVNGARIGQRLAVE